MVTSTPTRYFARRPCGYGRRGALDRGQVIELDGLPNDEKLVRLGYFMELPSRTVAVQCAECGAEFIGDSERNAHGRLRHSGRALDPQQEDNEIDRQERRLEVEAPLFLENTKASREAGVTPRIQGVPRGRKPPDI